MGNGGNAPASTPPASVVVESLDTNIDSLALHRRNPQRYPYLLASTACSAVTGRYDILFAFPGETLRWDNQSGTAAQQASQSDFLSAFDSRWREQRADCGPTSVEFAELPFFGGWFVFLAYELAEEIEPRLNLPPSAESFPVAFATRVPAAVIVDHASGRTHLVAERERSDLLPMIRSDIGVLSGSAQNSLPAMVKMQEDEEQTYLDSVARIKEYIAAGDVFQVNLSRCWRGHWDSPQDPAAVFEQLARANPAPFAGLVVTPWGSVISSSPERLVRVRGRRVETRPIAGTRPRGADAVQDQQMSEVLLAHPKERAEHVMLIDLERNDLGRVCVPGTVQVDELMVLESYAHVHHIVSNITGRLQVECTPADVLRAVFPGGTITGCPKVRCMEIIAELEQTGRGAYTGAMGYVNRDGSMDFNILIRTLALSPSGRELTFRAGAGIVADSDPQAELEETRAKARGLLRAVGQEDGTG